MNQANKGENMTENATDLKDIVSALNRLADAVDLNTRQAHYDALVSNGEMWHCVLCERYFPYINVQPVLIGPDNDKNVCLDCLRKMSQQNNQDEQIAS